MEPEQSIQQVSVLELKEKMLRKKAFHLLDVRTREEKVIADIGGQLIPVNEIEERFSELHGLEDLDIIIYCHHGMRSYHACCLLKEKGLKRVSNLSGGIDQWSLQVDNSISRY
jgi:rhodanese-related sulfurtransferase